MKDIRKRKTEHIDIVAKDASMDRRKFYFDDIRLTHRALPEINLADVDPSVEFLGKKLSFPFLISSMTGGSDEQIRTINHNLARAAEAEGVAMGVGSQRVMFSDPAARASFELRAAAPHALLFSNLGAVQINEGMTISQIRSAVDALNADALILHLNPLQEAVQPEGDINFSGLCEKIAEVVRDLCRPVIVKEVGAGISRADAELLVQAGVKIIDVAGAGGTSWSRIEAARSGDPSLGELFQDWGIPTPQALRELSDLDVTLIASGGIRTGIDMAKAMILDASLCGMARPLLTPAMESVDAVRAVIQRIRKEFVTAMFLLGAENVEQLKGNRSLILSS
ncbi:type 2 isopentenyl-diphosphate Delta-isomerase [Tichowtungia aerotolerans]|uniref:Isopentenyl-diphosphate delta-isomerase n=1 Tax=Tichowtungia aerotolerans TaxID=2697043 RepID=A0A6P1M4Z0_9BACT|nr:type 2 isopentenyl-diphosphate Delta-isomerase [Tichowtungia aerotolerans]QHI68907.1 type 2 isopentenyl-diphosphate Delta-isomerase [Tichowtungia aerotolerans]